MLKIWLVRHGQCDMNLTVDHCIGGRTNHSPLTPLGVEQARALGKHLCKALQQQGVAPQRCAFYSSTAVRAVDTALHIMDALEVPADVLTQSEEILELDQGAWEGRVRSKCFTPELTAQFAADPWGAAWEFQPPGGGESQKEVEERMTAYLAGQVLPHLTPDAPAIVVSHGMAMRCFLRGLLQSVPTMSRNIAMGNTSVTEVGFVRSMQGSSGNGSGDSSRGPVNGNSSSSSSPGDGAWHILRVNDLAHLPFDLRS